MNVCFNEPLDSLSGVYSDFGGAVGLGSLPNPHGSGLWLYFPLGLQFEAARLHAHWQPHATCASVGTRNINVSTDAQVKLKN